VSNFETNINIMIMRVVVGLFIFSIIVTTGCVSKVEEGEKPTVFVSIAPQKYFVERIADTLVQVEVMVPSGSSPETYEPTASQLRKLSSATAYFSLGLLEFELSMLKSIQKQNPHLLLVNHSKELNLLEGICDGHHHHGHSHSHGHDPHVWSSPAEVKIMVERIVKILSEKIPDYKGRFEENAKKFIADLDKLDSHIKKELAYTKTQKFFIFHPALTYFARDYGLTQIALEEDGKAPSMRHFKQVLATAKEQGATTIFIQKEFDANTAKTAAADIGGNVEVIDPLDENWLENMYHITNLIKKALNGE
jgi:zinc transport system substrate-binding protein